jgi:hypothetical protein
MKDLFKLILGILASLFKSRAKLKAEILILRQQINVLRRQAPKRPLSLPQTPFGWRVTPNRVMLLLNERYFQADLASGRRAFPIEGFA